MQKINNFEDLIRERRRLEGDLLIQKATLREALNELKARLEPLAEFASIVVGNNKETGAPSLLKTGVSIGIDLLLRYNLLARAGWVARAVLPIVVKGFLNRFIRSGHASEPSANGIPPAALPG